MHMESTVDLKEKQFNDAIKEHLVFFFIYVILCSIAYFIINKLRKLNERDDSVLDYEDDFADRVSISLCVFTFATSIGSFLLLPISIIANEVIINNHDNFYWKWLNPSLIYGLWNKIFLFSNLSLFFFIPFAYFFPEAIGLPGYKKGIKARVIETCLLIVVTTLFILGMSYIISSIVDSANAKKQSVLNLSDYHLPFLYSCISFLGVLFFLICTPLGFARLLTVVSHITMKRTFSNDSKEQMDMIKFEEASINRYVADLQINNNESDRVTLENHFKRLNELRGIKKQLTKVMQRPSLCRNICFSVLMFLLLILTVSSIGVVLINTFRVIFGYSPTKSVDSEKFNIGIKSLSKLGFFETFFEIILILYFTVASLVGLYSLPFLKSIKPNVHSTPIRQIILNCAIYLIFSSALPVSSKILGLTSFDLLGRFGDIKWLCNTTILLLYNFGFAVATTVCLMNICSATVRTELYNRVLMLFQLSFDNSLQNNRSVSTSSTFD